MSDISLTQIGQRGVNIVSKAVDLALSELRVAQNAEVTTNRSDGSIDQRPGMTRINASPVSGPISLALDVSDSLLMDKTPYLYAGLYTGATHNWRRTKDGSVWENDDTPSKPFTWPAFLSSGGATSVSSLLVGGGGGGGSDGGGGGGGAVLSFVDALSVGNYAIVVGTGGAGGVGGSTLSSGTAGTASTFNGHTAGGGGAGGGGGLAGGNGANGSSGGGAGGSSSSLAGGTGSSPGTNGGANATASPFPCGGGGGAGGVGGTGSGSTSGGGGVGTASTITGSSVTYGGGGSGGAHGSLGGGVTAPAAGGGGAGTGDTSTAGAGTDGLGGGGGGGGITGSSGGAGGKGGNGVVIVRYVTGSLTATGGTITTSGSFTVHTFTTSGTFAVTGAQPPLAWYKSYPKARTLNGKLYYYDNNSPIRLHEYDGTTDTILTSIPPAFSGQSLATPPAPEAGGNGPVQTGSSTYQVVAVAGSSHSAASAATVTVTGPNSISPSGSYNVLLNDNPTPVAGALQYDVYRTASSQTTGATGKIGSIPIVNGALSTGNGSIPSGINNFIFADDGIVGDGTAPPTTSAGTGPGDAIAILDMITDGTSLYFAVLDAIGSDPSMSGRLLQYTPATGIWLQLGASFPTSSGSGTAASLTFHYGALNFATYIGTSTGNTGYAASTFTPLPMGGLSAVQTTAAGYAIAALTSFQGNLYEGEVNLGAVAGQVLKGYPASPAGVLTGPGTGAQNGFTSITTFNGNIFAAWNDPTAAVAARIYTSPNGSSGSWTLDKTFGTTDLIGQMVVFSGCLYAVAMKTYRAENTTSSVWQRTTAGVWTQVDDPADHFAGCATVVYI